MKRSNLMFLFYLILSFYFVNFAFEFVKIPEFVKQFDNWIVFVGGIFLFIGGINFIKTKRHNL